MKQNMQPVVMHLICAAVVLGIMGCAVNPATQGDTRMNDLVLGDGSQWKYLGEQWREDEARVIQHPAGRDLHSRALYVNKAFSDVTVEFEYKAGYLEGGAGSAGLILRAPDGGHGYVVHFPWGGQTLRAKNFWAGLADLSGDGYLRHLRFVQEHSLQRHGGDCPAMGWQGKDTPSCDRPAVTEQPRQPGMHRAQWRCHHCIRQRVVAFH